ncbi:hypothetical protein N9Q05_02620 [bacterium]|nr:hypothetical protein [bacterium]
MATTASPYGLRPINLVGGTPFAGSTRAMKIASGYAADIFNGDIVQVHTDGTITKVTNVGTNADPFAAGTVGVFVGCAYTDATYGFTTRNYWPTGTVASDAVAYVVDDPNALFQVQADAPVAQALLHTNMGVNQTAGNPATGNSKVALDVTTSAATATIAFKVVGFVESTSSTVGDAFTDVIVKFNPSSHAYTAGLGVA